MSREIPITAESVVSWNESPVATEVDREVVLMNVGRGRFYGLGETGSSVWRRLGSPIRVDDLCRELMLEYHAEHEVLVRDVIALLEQMQEEGLIRVIAGESKNPGSVRQDDTAH
jgi:hypothetical protein